MKKYILKIITIIGVSLSIFTINAFAADNVDSETGLIIDKGAEEVKENCIVCHPARFMLINGGDKKFWSAKIKLMQKGFGLWDLEKETEDSIINYLSKNYSSKHKVAIDQ